ncbi:3BP5L protein, partial [Alcedo cyanopectus]|nr:3BP5L protein [Ceyx cyanopectus]
PHLSRHPTLPPLSHPSPLSPQEHKAKVTSLELLVSQAKTRYSVALRNLEQISEQIHARRLQRLVRRRSSPVGAEAAPPHPLPLESPSPGALGRREDPGGGGGGGEEEGSKHGDDLSVSSLRTIASDLQKFDSVEHLWSLSDATSLN